MWAIPLSLRLPDPCSNLSLLYLSHPSMPEAAAPCRTPSGPHALHHARIVSQRTSISDRCGALPPPRRLSIRGVRRLRRHRYEKARCRCCARLRPSASRAALACKPVGHVAWPCRSGRATRDRGGESASCVANWRLRASLHARYWPAAARRQLTRLHSLPYQPLAQQNAKLEPLRPRIA